jgi:hypothetical protein
MSEPTLRVLSLGAGVQSSVLALLAAEGKLPGLDAAIFADTGWEPAEVYENVDFLEGELAKAGIPLYRVGRGGSIRDDVLDPFMFATLPAYTVIDEEFREPLTWHVCDCAWGKLRKAGVADIIDYATFRDEGASLDHLEEMARIVPTDEDGEESAYAIAVRGLRAAGLTEVPTEHDACQMGRVVTSWHKYTIQRKGTIRRQCTGKYKIEPVERKIRELLGAPVREVPCRFCLETGQRVPPWDTDAGLGTCSVCRGAGVRLLVGSPPKGATVEQWIGFSTDEIVRVKTSGFPPYATPRFPLIELDMSRDDCLAFLLARGVKGRKSACVGCPFHRNGFWRQMRDERPEQWADAVAFDRAFRRAPGLNGQRFLHESCLPLDQAPIDRLTRKERAAAQTDIFGLIEDEDEDDAPGCSPFGCRAGGDSSAVDLGLPGLGANNYDEEDEAA